MNYNTLYNLFDYKHKFIVIIYVFNLKFVHNLHGCIWDPRLWSVCNFIDFSINGETKFQIIIIIFISWKN